jgi:hypothetical protein
MNKMPLILALLTAASARADSAHNLDFRFHETNDKVTQDRRYSLMLTRGAPSKLNTGLRVPYFMKEKEVHTVVATGTVIECRGSDKGAVLLGLECGFESNAMPPRQPRPAAGLLPLINTRSIHVTTVVRVGKEYKLAALDDPVTGGRLEIFVTARPVND